MQRFVTFVTFLKTGCIIDQNRVFVKLFETFFQNRLTCGFKNDAIMMQKMSVWLEMVTVLVTKVTA